jgi:hypothetical protein
MMSIIHRGDRIIVRLAGRLVGSCAEDLRDAALPGAALEVDLSDLTFADLDGQRSLASLRRMGARFRAEGADE